MSDTVRKDLGAVSAYAYAVEQGYAGTEEEFAELMASYADVAETAAQSASDAADSADEAKGYKNDASDSAGEAASSASGAETNALKAEGYAVGKQNGSDVASGSDYYHANSAYYASQASASATAAGSAQTAAETAQGKAEDAQTAAETAQGKAEDAQEAAETAQTAAETAQGKAEDAQDAAEDAQTAAEAAQSAAEDAQEAAETAASTFSTDTTLAVSGKAADAKKTGDEIAGLKSTINVSETANKRAYTTGKYINVNGATTENSGYAYIDYVPCDEKTTFILRGIWTGSSSLAYAFYNESKTFISGQNNVVGDITVSTIPSGAKFVRFSSRISSGENPIAIVYNVQTFEENVHTIKEEVETINANVSDMESEISQMQDDIDELKEDHELVAPRDTTFFDGVNYFEPDKAILYTDRYIDTEGKIKTNSSVSNTLVVPVKPNTEYYLNIPSNNRQMVGESSDNDFSIGLTKNVIHTNIGEDPIHFTTGATTHYIGIYFYSGTYDYALNKNNIVLNVDFYAGSEPPYIPHKYLPKDLTDVLDNATVLIFGDSITDTCNFTIDSEDQTSAVTWRNHSNSYINEGGTTIYYSMWPKILKESQKCKEIRNYACSGASYKTSARTAGEERKNLQYQIDVALNDRLNPNDVFTVDDFTPDIVVFALGTNDGTPNDTFDTAMAKTVLQSDGYSIDVAATLAALDESKFCESVRKAFMRIKQAFPLAQIYCVLPIQASNNDTGFGTQHEYLKAMAERYGCIIIDGKANSGITRDFNNLNALGTYLKDGLHPNEKGQNLMARMIIASLKSHFIPFGIGFNTIS